MTSDETKLFSLPETAFPWLVMAAAVIVFAVMMIFRKRAGVRSAAVEWYTLFAIPLGVFMGHLFFAVSRVGEYLSQEDYGFAFFFTPWRGGFMFWGVVLGCWLAILLASACARQSRDQRRRLTDLAAVGLILLIALIRLAEPFDTVMGRGQGFVLPVEGSAPSFFPFAFSPEPEYPEDRYYAIFMAEALYALGVFLFALIGMKRRPAGKTAGLTLLLYAAGQVFFEFVRQDYTVRSMFIRISQVISAAVLVLLLILAVAKRRITLGDFFLRLTGFALLACMIICMEFADDGKPFMLDAQTLQSPAVQAAEGVLAAGVLLSPLVAAIGGAGTLGFHLAAENAEVYDGNVMYFFPHWQAYLIIFACALCMAFLVWLALYPLRRDTEETEEALS